MASAGMDNHDALRAATLLGAEAIGFGNDLGSIEPGKLADLAVLDRDLMTIPAGDIRNVEVEMTVVGGQVMFARN